MGGPDLVLIFLDSDGVLIQRFHMYREFPDAEEINKRVRQHLAENPTWTYQACGSIFLPF